MGRLEIDRRGLSKLLANKPKAWMLYELLQNAWDEDGCTLVTAGVEYDSDNRLIKIEVIDNAPGGFSNLAHSYTLFAESYKKEYANKRGRFNLGDKLLVAVSEEMSILTTKGEVKFIGDERQENPKVCTPMGSLIRLSVKGSRADYQAILDGANQVIVPHDIVTKINDRILTARKPLATFEETLPTVIGEDLRPTMRKTVVEVYEPQNGESASIYEMGIPVVETGDRFHYNIQQKVPLNQERDNVTPAFLKLVRAFALNHIHDKLHAEDFTQPWVNVAVQSKEVKTEAVNSYLDAKYGHQRAIFDPTAPESMHRLQSAGWTIIHGRQEASSTWDKVREGGLARPAGQVLPVKIENLKGAMAKSEWTGGMNNIAKYSQEVAKKLIGADIQVSFVNDVGSGTAACFGAKSLCYNVGRLGYDWFNHGPTAQVNALLIHELGHHYSESHFDDAYFRALCKLGAGLTDLALNEPQLFKKYGHK